jgi:hypothetical protein
LAGSSPAEAVANFVRPLQLAASCVTREVLDVHGGYHPAASPHALTLGAEEPARLQGPGELALSVTLHYRIVEAPGARGPWKVSTAGYLYAVDDAEGREVLAYHWHPHGRRDVTAPHLHLGAGAMVGRERLVDAHLPTGRVALEALIRCAIAELDVEPLRSDWHEVLDAAEAGFEAWRTWPNPGARPGT